MVENDQNTNQKPIKDQTKIDQKSIEHHSNIEPKTIEHRANIEQKSTNITAGSKNVAKFVLGAVLEASWTRFQG